MSLSNAVENTSAERELTLLSGLSMRGFFVANDLAVFFLLVDSKFSGGRKTPKRRGVRLDEGSVGLLWT